MKVLSVVIVFIGLAISTNALRSNFNYNANAGLTVNYNAIGDAPDTTSLVKLPGKGMFQHPFLYTGEWDYRKPVQTIFLVRKGKVAWSYDIPFKDSTGVMEELGDATMRSNGNIVFCRKVGVSEITSAKKIIWNYDAPVGTEIHSVQPLGLDRVLFVINGVPARVRIVNIITGKIEREFTLPTGKPSPHLQFRRVRMTPSGTFLAAHLDANKVAEYDSTGKEIWSYSCNGPWSASRLKNGNTLITSYASNILEVNSKGDVVWEFTQKDIPDIKLFIIQEAVRLPNGNTVFCNWCPIGVKDTLKWPTTVQVLEVNRDRKLVWALKQWKDPDLGPASSIQLLDQPDMLRIKFHE